jgi:hypothetical protein
LKNRSSEVEKGHKTHRSKTVFSKWVQDRILLVWIFILSFVVLDSFFTYIGVNIFGIAEKNIFVTFILDQGHGWFIWLILKVVIAVFATSLFFLVYYAVSTSKMAKKDRDGVLLFELCGWVYLVSLNLFSVLIWTQAFIGRMN